MYQITIPHANPFYSIGSSFSDVLGGKTEQNNIYISTIQFNRELSAALSSVEISFMIEEHTCQKAYYPFRRKADEIEMKNLYFDVYTYGVIDKIRISCFDSTGEHVHSTDFRVKRYKNQTSLIPPLKGKVALIGGAMDLTGHRTIWRSEFSEDLMIVRDGSISPSTQSVDQHPSFGAKVIAPAGGTIVAACDGLPDNSGLYDYDSMGSHIDRYTEKLPEIHLNGGNFIIIDHGHKEFSVLFHLKCNSLAIKVGQRVEAGELIAECGHSGYGSVAPHLHYQLVDSPDPMTWRSLPFRFSGYDSEVYPSRAMESLGIPEELAYHMQATRVQIINS